MTSQWYSFGVDLIKFHYANYFNVSRKFRINARTYIVVVVSRHTQQKKNVSGSTESEEQTSSTCLWQLGKMVKNIGYKIVLLTKFRFSNSKKPASQLEEIHAALFSWSKVWSNDFSPLDVCGTLANVEGLFVCERWWLESIMANAF